MFSKADKVKKAFVICNKGDYGFIKRHFLELFGNIKDTQLVFPLDFYEENLGKKINKDSTKYLKLVLNEIDSDDFFKEVDSDSRMIVAKNSSIKLSEKSWLRAKLADSKKKISRADSCLLLVNEDNHYDYQTYDEITDEISYADKKGIAVKEVDTLYSLTSSPLVYTIGQKKQG